MGTSATISTEQKALELDALARKAGASGSVVYVRFPESLVLTYPRHIWSVPHTEVERLKMFKDVERVILASATTNPLRKYMILNSLSYRDLARILGKSHVRVMAICGETSNPSAALRAEIARIIPEVDESAWPKPPSM